LWRQTFARRARRQKLERGSAVFPHRRGKGSVIVAVGWTGQWRCDFANENNRLVVSAGIENADFFMRPGEKFAFGSMAALFYKSGPNFENFEANNLFRKLLLDEYLPKIADRGGLKKTPYLFCNTCFTRGGHWLNECNEKNQISLIKALEPLGCEAAITDAGWFEKGWPLGAGNWDADPEKYPDGFLPVSNAAKDAGMKYGLWFEFERVVAGTEFAKTCGDWLLSSETGKLWGESGDEHFLLNLGVPEAVDHIYGIIEKKIKAEGIKCYRQDFNLNPLSYWLKNDEPGRAGVTEIKYVNGLYGYLDRIRTNFPDVFMDGCSSGGRRIDLEMLKRFHTHQKTDFWFDPAVDQNSLFSLSHYIPNVAFTAHVNCFDDYGFNSAMAATLCLGWIADGNGEYGGKGKYEAAGAKKLIERYNGIRPFLNCSFYPLTEPNEKDAAALAFEFFDEEKNSGAIFIFAREKCGLKKIELKLKGIEDGKIYSLKDLATDKIFEAAGKDLKEGFVVNIDELPFTKVYKIEQKNNCLA